MYVSKEGFQHKIYYVNDTACEIMGYTREEYIRKMQDGWADLMDADLREVIREHNEQIRSGTPFEVLSRPQTKNGGYKWILSRVNVQLQDSFTKLLNRGALEKHVCEALQERGVDEEEAFILLDVDNFKQINDIYGHGVGDMILMRMVEILNEVFGDHSCIGRMGGDEFAVFLRDIGDRREIEEKIQKLLEEVRAEKGRMHLRKEPTASVSVAFVPESGSTFVDVYRAADQALYHVKNSMKNGMAFYDFV